MKRTIPFLITLIKQGSLVKQIIAGLVFGHIGVALAFPGFAQGCGVLGSFFVSSLESRGSGLGFCFGRRLHCESGEHHEYGHERRYRSLFGRYIPGRLSAVFASFLSRTQIALLIRRMHYQRPAASAKL